MEETEILIIGANGQLGHALQTQYPGAKAVDSDVLDITNQLAVEQFDWTNIRLILNAAAYTNVDGAETPDGRIAAWKINADGVANLVALAAQKDMTLVHVSTDYVFDGSTEIHTETEPFSPLSVYGSSKAAGDLAVSLLPKYYLLRTSWVIGDGKNFVRTMLGLAEKNISPTVVADQVGRLTFTSELTRAIHHFLTNDAPYGTYNVTNDGKPASWADVARRIFKYSGYGKLQVTDTTTKEYFSSKAGVAPRPLNSTLSLERLHSTNFESHNWEDDLRLYIEKELAK